MQNFDVVFFNRVPKTGSQMMQELAGVLAIENDFTVYIDPTPLELFPQPPKDQQFIRNWKKRVASPGMYFRHIPWKNFSQLNSSKPIWVSMVRNPVERILSWFYYIRWRNRPDDDNEDECNSSDEMKDRCLK